MLTDRRTYRGPRTSLSRLARFAATLLPLPGLLVPATAQAEPSVTIALCSASGKRSIALPARDAPTRLPDDGQGCAHFVCPRERADDRLADDEKE